MPQKGGGLLAKYGLSRNPFTDRTAEKTDLVSPLYPSRDD